MRCNPSVRVVLSASALLLATSVEAQELPFNTTETGSWFQAGQQFADVWGDGNLAYLAHNGQRVVTIIDITDPANPVFASRYDALSPSSAQDVKVGDGLLFVGLEESSLGVHIVDVRDPYAPVKLTDVTVMPSVHNVFYDEGWLYIVDSGTPVIRIVDLRAYDPDNPPAVIDTPTWTLTGVGSTFVHDITVQDGRLYASAWDSLRVYDVSDIENQAPVLLGSIYGDSAHAAWPTDDGRFVVMGEEHTGGGLTLYEIVDDAMGFRIEARDYFFVSSDRAGSAHNPLVDGYRVYVSYYAVGVQVLEIDPDTATWQLVASFDTTPADGDDSIFAGCWGTYPFLGADQVLASDRALGLSVLDVDPNVLRFSHPTELPETLPPSGGAFSVKLDAIGAAIMGGTVLLHTSIDGGTIVDQAFVDQGDGTYAGTWPVATCGSAITYSLSAENALGSVFVDPPGAPTTTYRVDVTGVPETVLQDDFSTDLGWIVENTNLATGAWERGDPVGTGPQPEFDATGAVDGMSYFTAQGAPGGSFGVADVDGGPTVLTSPFLDFAEGDGFIVYSYWLFNDDLDDGLVVEVSGDGTTWVEVQRHESSLGGWERASFRVSDFMGASDQTQVRFVVADDPNNSITEAAIDSFHAYRLNCGQSFEDGFESGDTSAWTVTIP